jgi:predicted phage tail protein
MFIVLLVVLALLGTVYAKNPALGSYNITDVTVSGLSSGAFMAVQMHVAFSETINGAAIFAGGPYYCAQGNLMYAYGQCMDTYLGVPMVERLVSQTRQDATQKKIDDPSNLADDRVYLFSGKSDTVVHPEVMQSLQDYYLSFIKATNLVGDYNFDAEHCLPTLDYGEACTRLSSPYIGKCNFDGAGAAFQTLYGEDIVAGKAVAANLKAFDQTEFGGGKSGYSLDDVGYVYVPTACASGSAACHLHVSFHGCNQDISNIDTQYAENTGFNNWAEANNVIVLYPYATTSMMPSNPNACWDWWAYTGKDYAYKTGVQMKFAKDMIDRVMKK